MPALESGADVIITGRVADPSLFVAPIAHHFGWRLSELDRVGRATVVGHLLECAGQVSGGYFADPGRKDVPDIANLGFPFAEVDREGNAVLGKVDGTGGAITLATVKEQLLYEASDPGAYLTPDVTADFTGVVLTQLAKDRVGVTGGCASGKSSTLKVSIGYLAGYLGEGEMSYAGRNARARGSRAGCVGSAFKARSTRFASITSAAPRRMAAHSTKARTPYEIRLRVAARASSAEEARSWAKRSKRSTSNGPGQGGAQVRHRADRHRIDAHRPLRGRIHRHDQGMDP